MAGPNFKNVKKTTIENNNKILCICQAKIFKTIKKKIKLFKHANKS